MLYRQVVNIPSDQRTHFLPPVIPAPVSSTENTTEGDVVGNEAEILMLECIGGGRISSPGPTYLDEGKVVPDTTSAATY